MNKECIFCKIVKGQMGIKFIKESKNLVVFEDKNPQAPIHYLIVPRKHISDVTVVDDELWSEIKDVAVGIAKSRSMPGFRIVHNAGDAALVKHLHIHFLGEVTGERSL
jgi:histidine triad (HIT) family protein